MLQNTDVNVDVLFVLLEETMFFFFNRSILVCHEASRNSVST